MTANALPLTPSTRLERVEALQARIRGMQATRLDRRGLPTAPAFAELLPGGVLREGTVVEVHGSTSLIMALLAEPSAAGRWTAVVGLPSFGIEAAERFGLDLDRLVLVPEPGGHWLAVLAALAEVIPVIAVRPGGRVLPAEASRLGARLRERGGSLLVAGDWPGSDASLQLETSAWSGLVSGHGLLDEREIVVSATGRGEFARRRRARLRLPEGSRGFEAVPAEASAPLVPIAAVRRAG